MAIIDMVRLGRMHPQGPGKGNFPNLHFFGAAHESFAIPSSVGTRHVYVASDSPAWSVLGAFWSGYDIAGWENAMGGRLAVPHMFLFAGGAVIQKMNDNIDKTMHDMAEVCKCLGRPEMEW
jgi:hypothetical protein